MAVTLTSLTDLAALGFDDIIDVRAPSEFAEDHLPGAISLPVLNDAERARDASPEDRELLLEVCDAYSSAGRADDAIKALEQIVESYGGRRSKELADILISKQEKSGAWFDFPLYDYGHYYGTAYALLSLISCQAQS